MPMPLSRTRSTTSLPSAAAVIPMCPPLGVYFPALVSRLDTT